MTEPREGSGLAGVTVLVTRAPGQASRLTEALRAEDANVVEVPAIEIVAPETWEGADRAIALGGYDWCVFSSENGVRSFLDRLSLGHAAEDWFRESRIAAVGPATARALRNAGLTVDLVPEDFAADALVASLLDRGDLMGRLVLFPHGDIARETLTRELDRVGAILDAPTVYRTVTAKAPEGFRAQLASGEIDVVTFTSSSTVRALVEMAGGSARALKGITIACIGPVTAATAREVGLEPHVVAETATIESLVRALCERRPSVESACEYEGVPTSNRHT